MNIGFPDDKTIYALSSAAGKAGIAVIRLSGSKIDAILTQFFPSKKPYLPRRIYHCKMKNPLDEEIIDDVILFYFVTPTSYTGEDVLEIHCHGGEAVLTAIFSAFAQIPFLRLAEAGEFTRRAVLNGKMDLTIAEGLLDLINAETEMQRKFALQQTTGNLYKKFEAWTKKIQHSLAHLEAVIDFSDEDIPSSIEKSVAENISFLLEEIKRYMDAPKIGERLHKGVRVTLLGPTNSGKSTFLNYLVGDERALVSSQAGTTRDIIEVRLNLGGFPIILTDTAGLRKSKASSLLECRGMENARLRAKDSDFVIAFYDATRPKFRPKIKADYIIDNKIDRLSKAKKTLLQKKAASSSIPYFLTSLHHPEGIDVFLEKLQSDIASYFPEPSASLLTRTRYREALFHVKQFLEDARKSTEIELKAENLRQALRFIGQITGKYDVEPLLDIIFRDFCLGK